MVRKACNGFCLDHFFLPSSLTNFTSLQNEILFSLLIPSDPVWQVRDSVNAQGGLLGLNVFFYLIIDTK